MPSRLTAAVLLLFAVGILASAQPSSAQPSSAAPLPAAASRVGGPVLLILDASGSMLERDRAGSRKIDGAKRAVRSLIGELPSGTPVGLRVFGRRAASMAGRSACHDSDLVMPVRPLRRAAMRSALGGFRARGWTPLAYALRQGAADLPHRSRGSIVLVSDGVDECYPRFGESPCAVARDLARSSIDLKVQTIGITADARARRQLRCIARATGGRYWDVDDSDSLAKALKDSVPRLEKPVEVPVPEPPSGAPIGASILVLLVVITLTGLGLLGRTVLSRRKQAYW